MYMRAINDPFLERFFSRIPRDLVGSFTDDQLLAIKQAFADTAPRQHLVDVRLPLRVLWKRYYVVFLFGQERRTPARLRSDRRARKGSRLASLGFGFIVLVLALLAVFGGLYMIKSAIGLDLLPGFSFGLWDDISSQIRLMLH